MTKAAAGSREAFDEIVRRYQQTELAELFAGRREQLEGFHRVKPSDAPHGLTLARPREVRARFEQEQRALRDAVREILTTEQGEGFPGLWQPGRRGFEGTRRPSGTLDRLFRNV